MIAMYSLPVGVFPGGEGTIPLALRYSRTISSVKGPTYPSGIY
jgi:hypothetical protein